MIKRMCIYMYIHIWSSCKIPVNLVRFSKNTQISNFTKIGPVEAELFFADRRKDGHDKADSRFSQYCGITLKVSCMYMDWIQM
jgi:hypothetical protein